MQQKRSNERCLRESQGNKMNTVGDAKYQLGKRICQYANSKRLYEYLYYMKWYLDVHSYKLRCGFGEIITNVGSFIPYPSSIKFEFKFFPDYNIDLIVNPYSYNCFIDFEKDTKETIDQEIYRLQKMIDEHSSKCQHLVNQIDNFFKV